MYVNSNVVAHDITFWLSLSAYKISPWHPCRIVYVWGKVILKAPGERVTAQGSSKSFWKTIL